MKRAIVTLAMVLALVGLFGLTGSTAANANTWTAPRCTQAYSNYIGAPGSCPVPGQAGPNAPTFMGAVGF